MPTHICPLLYVGHFHLIMPSHIHHLSIYRPFPSHYSSAHAPPFYTRAIFISLCNRIYTPVLYVVHFHLIMPPHIHPPLYAGHFHLIIPLHIHPLSIHGQLIYHYAPAYTPPLYTRTISISLCPRVYTAFLYADHFHLIIPPHIHPLSICGQLVYHYATAYTLPFYTRAISISLCPCIYITFLYAGHFHLVVPLCIHPTVYTQVYLLHLELRIHTLGCICRVIHSTNCSAYMPNSIYSGIFITLRTPHIYLGVYSDTERDGIEMWQT